MASASCWVAAAAAAGRSVAELAAAAELAVAVASLSRCWFSTYSVIIIIATDPVAQLTMGEPVQKADDMLPLTSSAILIRLPVGVMFWKASLNALSSAATTLGLGVHVRLPLSPAPFWYVSIATRTLYGWILERLMSAASVMRSQMSLTEGVMAAGVMTISAVLSFPKLRMSAVRGIPFPLPLAPLLWRSASQTFRYLKSCDGSCSRQRPMVLMRWTIRLSSSAYW